jgi:hypothetical protein
LTSDFLNVKTPNKTAIPIGNKAIVPRGKNANTMLKEVKILVIIKNNFLIIGKLNS